MNPLEEARIIETRRQFLARGKNVLGFAALSSLLGESFLPHIAEAHGDKGVAPDATGKGPAKPRVPHFAPKAKNVIYLHMVGGPAQMDLYDYKPKMAEMYDKDLPESIRKGQRLTTMTSGQARFPIAPSKYTFHQRGKCGMWMTELLHHLGTCADDMVFIRSMNTEAINHEPAICFIQTGSQVTGKPCLGS